MSIAPLYQPPAKAKYQLRSKLGYFAFHQVSRFDYLMRHLRKTLPYLTARKLANLALNLAEWKFKTLVPRSMPPYLKVESTPVCQMSCTGCSHHDPDYKRQFHPAMNLTLEDFKRVIDPVKDTLLGVTLSLRGEPLLNRNLPEIVGYAHQEGIATSFPTNLSVQMSERTAYEIVSSGLDAMYVSLDGTTEETYARYRVGGDFQLVVKNVRLLAEAKKALQSKRPKLIWKLVVFDYNEGEMEIVRRTHKSLGFDGYEFVPDWSGQAFASKKRIFNTRLVQKKRACFFPWNAMVITSEGDVKPCCHEPRDFALGNAIRDGVREVWRGKAYHELRAGFATKTFGKNMHEECKACIGYAEATGPSAQLVQIEERSNEPKQVRANEEIIARHSSENSKLSL
jgi:radical SAM protein with 4Fe4S-binding SPASM domain